MARRHRGLALVVTLLLLVLAMPFAVYLPMVQSWVRSVVEEQTTAAIGMDVKVGEIGISYPLELTVNNVVVAHDCDTMLAVERAAVAVRIFPLLSKRIEVEDVQMEGVIYCQPIDSALTIDACVERMDVGLVGYDLEAGGLNVACAKLAGVKYRMRLENVVDSLGAHIENVRIDSLEVDVEASRLRCGTLCIDSADVAYIAPIEKMEIAEDEDTTSVLPWTIEGCRVELHRGKALYAMLGHSPCEGLDPEYISLDEVDVVVNDFYSRGSELRVPVERIAAVERCGLEVDSLSGVFAMDSLMVRATGWRLATALSHAAIDAEASIEALALNPKGVLSATVDGDVNINEVARLYPSLATFLAQIPTVENTKLAVRVGGELGNLKIEKARVEMPRYATLAVDGVVRNVTTARRTGRVAVNGNLANINFVKPTFLDVAMRKQVHFPPMQLKGDVAFVGTKVDGQLTVRNADGDMSLTATVNGAAQDYDVALDVMQFPLNSIMPFSGLGTMTASLTASGTGLNPLQESTTAQASLTIAQAEYKGKTIRNVAARAQVENGLLMAKLSCPNEGMDFDVDATATLLNDRYEYRVDADVRHIDMQALNLAEEMLEGKMRVKSHGVVDLANKVYDVKAEVVGLEVSEYDYTVATDRIAAELYSAADTTMVKLKNRDLVATLQAESVLDSLVARLSQSGDELMAQIERKHFRFTSIDSLLPQFRLRSSMGRDNIVYQYCKYNNINFNNVSLNATNDTLFNVSGEVERLQLDALRLDTITVAMREKNEAILCDLHVGNRPGNLDEMAMTDVYGFLSDNYFNLLLDQRNRAGRQGFYVGVNGSLDDSLFVASLFPAYPIIGHDEWELNGNNYIEYDYKNKKLNADVWLSHANSVLSINAGSSGNGDDEHEVIQLLAHNIDVSSWLKFSPFAPDVAGWVNADVNLSYNEKNYWGKCEVSVDSLRYDGTDVGNVGFATTLDVNPITNLTEAMASLSLNGNEAIAATGVVNDSTLNNPMRFNLQVKRLPLKVIEAFVPEKLMKANGFLVGDVTMSGSTAQPVFNGRLVCDSAYITLPAYGCRLNFDRDSVRVVESVVLLDHFDLLGTNGNRITIDGSVDINNMNNPYCDLTVKGRNVEIINSKNHSRAEVFGKGSINVDALVKGRTDRLIVNADIGLLESTNITYVMSDEAMSAATSAGDDVLEFVQFNDTIVHKKPVEEVGAFSMNLHANLNIEPGAAFTIFISTSGNDRAYIMGNGALSFAMNSQGDMHLSGRYNIDEGYVRYSPPLIGVKHFDIVDGSYVGWSDDPLDPQLNLTAQMKQTNTVIAEGENSQRVKFVITAEIDNTLSNPNINFDLAAENNLSIQSELLSMSRDQRSNQAINLLLYNNYTGSITSSVSSPNSNMLYAFLSSQLNNWASRIVKGVDISLGIKEYNSNTTTRSMNYSYQISKSLFDNRFKMSVGGNYDTSQSGDNTLAQNLLNDISFEYLITPAGTMSVQIYSHLTHDDIFKDNVTETGAAFVIRRKLNTLRNLFNFKRESEVTQPEDSTTTKQ